MSVFIWFFLYLVVLVVAGPEETKNPSGGKCPPPDSDPFSDAEFPGFPDFWQYAELRTNMLVLVSLAKEEATKLVYGMVAFDIPLRTQ
jgi:hypothetical protein